jgi:endonuclease/exonuclease/phosphatase family metal-dependent hydrolase
LVAAWAAWAVIRLFGLEYGFPLEAMMAFTPLVAATAIIPIAAALLAGSRAGAALATVVLVVFAVLVVPREFGGPTDAAGGNGPVLRVLAANMKLGKADPDALLGLVRELHVDVLSIEEQTPKLAGGLARAGIADLLPYAASYTDRGSSGSGLYSRLPLLPGSNQPLPGGSPLIVRGLGVPGAAQVTIFSVHTHSPTNPSWRDDLRALPAAAEQPQILLGDFNATLDQAEFRDLLDRGYDDAAETLGDGLTPTWPANRRFPPLVTIDHVLADRRIGIREYSVEDLPGSDHRAVYAALALPLAGTLASPPATAGEP